MKVTVCDLIANKHTQYTEADREWLSVLNEEQLAAMMPVNIPEVKEVTNNNEAKPLTYEELLATAPAEVRAQHEFVANMVKKTREDLITKIKANEHNKFTDEQLNSMPDTLLQATAESFAPVANYSGMGGSQVIDNANTEEPLSLPSFKEESK